MSLMSIFIYKYLCHNFVLKIAVIMFGLTLVWLSMDPSNSSYLVNMMKPFRYFCAFHNLLKEPKYCKYNTYTYYIKLLASCTKLINYFVFDFSKAICIFKHSSYIENYFEIERSDWLVCIPALKEWILSYHTVKSI
jgi:hypothetical protein